MRPELFTIPLINISVKSYGFMMVLGFIAAMLLARRRCRLQGENPDHITNFSVYVLLAGIVGARIMFVLHHPDEYKDNFLKIFAIWSGGLEFLGGVICAILVMVIYLKRKKLSVLKYLDILAPALMLGLAFGRMGCLLNGCCFGAVCDLPWAIRFPAINYRSEGIFSKESPPSFSYPYAYQLIPHTHRHKNTPATVTLPYDYYYGYSDHQGNFCYSKSEIPADQKDNFFPKPKSAADLNKYQLDNFKQGMFPMHPVHPTQFYSILNALLLCAFLTSMFRYYKFPGQIIASMLILYGIARFSIEMLRTEPLEFTGLTISQNVSLALIITGIILIAIYRRHKIPQNQKE
ncbi:MAG: prolipoprotein diacylglyceryl transferase [Sedimentisphaerales bacterium]|nr:prolipoprotein diacylglyceryl transferase [Sedimentisphaerales bacterium]